MIIKIKNLKNEIFELDIDNDISVNNLINLVKKHLNLKLDTIIKLIFQGKMLLENNHKLVKDVGLIENAILILFVPKKKKKKPIKKKESFGAIEQEQPNIETVEQKEQEQPNMENIEQENQIPKL